MNDQNQQDTVTPLPEFFPEFANAIVVALTTYGATLRLAVEYTENPNDEERLALLQTISRRVGIELIAFLRSYDMMRGNFTSQEDPAPVIGLARVLGESITLFGAVTDAVSAERAPVASLTRIDEEYTEAAKAWLRQYVAEIPERTKE